MRARYSHRLIGRRAMQIDIASLRIDVCATIDASFQTAQPQDARKDPVAPGVVGGQGGVEHLPRRTPAAEYRARRQSSTDGRTHVMPTERRLATSLLLTDTGGSTGNRMAPQTRASPPAPQTLCRQIDFQPCLMAWRQFIQTGCAHADRHIAVDKASDEPLGKGAFIAATTTGRKRRISSRTLTWSS